MICMIVPKSGQKLSERFYNFNYFERFVSHTYCHKTYKVLIRLDQTVNSPGVSTSIIFFLKSGVSNSSISSSISGPYERSRV